MSKEAIASKLRDSNEKRQDISRRYSQYFGRYTAKSQ